MAVESCKVIGAALAFCIAAVCSLLPSRALGQQSLADNVTSHRELVSQPVFVQPAISYVPTSWLLTQFGTPGRISNVLLGAGVGPRLSDAPGVAPKVDAGKVKDRAEVTFCGYQSLPGDRGIVFVELTDPVAVEVSRNGQVIEYRLVGATVPLKNNRNPLLLRDFSSSATSARLVADKKAVRLLITLRGNVAPSHRMVSRGKGAALEVELPPPAASAT